MCCITAVYLVRFSGGGYRVQDTGYKGQGMGHRSQGAGERSQGTGERSGLVHLLLDPGGVGLHPGEHARLARLDRTISVI